MTGLAYRFQGFSGLIPRLSDRLLPENGAVVSSNTNLLSGEIRGYNSLLQVNNLTTVGFTIRKAYRIPDTGIGETWLPFDEHDTDVVKSPLANDLYNRFFFAGKPSAVIPNRPLYNSEAQLHSSGVSSSYWLGIPSPVTDITLTPPAIGSTDVPAVRAYVYTWVSEWGEEGPPSKPIVATGASVGTWALSTLEQSTSINTTDFPSGKFHTSGMKRRIYRTVPGYSSALFFRVDEIAGAGGITTYNDTKLDNEVVQNPQLESTTWQPPPSNLVGFVSMPNGFMAGWFGRTICFSEPYRPHAWPVEYQLATEYDIVGMGVIGGYLVIATTSNLYIGQGVSPSSFTLQKTDFVEPCLSRRGMVSSSSGVYYPSPNGLILVNNSGPSLITQNLLTKQDWLKRYDPYNLLGTQNGVSYFGLFEAKRGILLTPSEAGQTLIEIDLPYNVTGIDADKYNGEVYLIMNNYVYQWNPPNTKSLYWNWRSKEIHLDKPVNLGAAKIKWEDSDTVTDPDLIALYQAYNDARFQAPLNTINGGTLGILGGVPLAGQTINGVQSVGWVNTGSPSPYPAGWGYPENIMPVGGSQLYTIFTDVPNTNIKGVVLRVYANKSLVFENTILDEKVIRLPAGFKTDIWQFEMASNSSVYSLQVAETSKGLEKA